MARRKKIRVDHHQPYWLLTFSDLNTLLLTFFVLLFSMSSLESGMISRIVAAARDVGFMEEKAAGRLPERLRVAAQLLEDPRKVVENRQRLKDLLWPDEVMPREIARGELEKNLQILAKDDGVALVLSDALLFDKGQVRLRPTVGPILGQLALVLGGMTAGVNLAGHSDDEGGRTEANFALSAARALAVLDFFQKYGVDPRRLSASAYGPDHPADQQGVGEPTAQARDASRRVEILVKVRPDVGGYQ